MSGSSRRLFLPAGTTSCGNMYRIIQHLLEGKPVGHFHIDAAVCMKIARRIFNDSMSNVIGIYLKYSEWGIHGQTGPEGRFSRGLLMR